MMNDTEEKLYRWAEWSRGGGVNIGYKSSMGIVMRDAVGSTVKTINMTDEEALLVDNAVGKLKARDFELYYVVQLKYVRRYSLRDMAKQLHVSREKASQWTAAAVAWIDSAIENNEAA